MIQKPRSWIFLTLCVTLFAGHGNAQVSRADYENAQQLNKKYSKLALNIPDTPVWLGDTDQFVYRKTVEDGHAFVLVDANALTQRPAFDQAKLAAALSTASGTQYNANDLPFPRFRYVDGQSAIEFAVKDAHWHCDLRAYACSALPGPPRDADDYGYDDTPKAENSESKTKAAPDGNWLAFIENYNVFVHAKDGSKKTALSTDGSEGNYYAFDSIAWSPNSKQLVAYRIRPGYRRVIHYVESSPTDQLQPEYSSMIYPKAGDVLALQQPVLFSVTPSSEIPIDNSLFPNPYRLSHLKWWKDGRGFTFEYNQRGHQIYRVIEVDASTGKARALISERSDTFVNYERLVMNQFDTGKIYRYDVNDGKEIIWASERDGWEHLYLFNGTTGKLENHITKGDWVVRAVNHVDEQKRQIWFEASGMNPGEDPYFVDAYRINFDGTGLTPLTKSGTNHHLEYSNDGKYYVDTYSRIDLPPTMELHRTADNTLLMTVDKGDISKLIAAGWHPPMVFKAKGRDGKTDIWGVIYKPANFDPHKRYHVIEAIYAGPQGSFVPKSFSTRAQPLTQLGFVVVQIDGMGTNNRSKAFHNVAWKNLKDAGFPDRILWHKAAAAKYPWYDISRVGIFGTSAGGQSAMGALLFHPEFYKVAVANSGSHDNRMDKIWWNEQWMGWPVGPQYAASSNVDNAWRLQGKLMLVMGEMDRNVDPSTTLQVVNALIKANKTFDFLFVPGGGHGAGGAYGQRKLEDFFVHNVLGQEPPDWNADPAPKKPQ
jgi:dipeptidyl aminopeptidase/acylaminoacyl peptidase